MANKGKVMVERTPRDVGSRPPARSPARRPPMQRLGEKGQSTRTSSPACRRLPPLFGRPRMEPSSPGRGGRLFPAPPAPTRKDPTRVCTPRLRLVAHFPPASPRLPPSGLKSPKVFQVGPGHRADSSTLRPMD